MKTKIYIGIITAALTPGFLAEAQISDFRNFGNNEAGIVINNYYNYDYYYASRINRFHRSYATFSYYAPVFTDTYWYSYQPYTWGMTIYGGGRIGVGVMYNYPIYYSYWEAPWYIGWNYGWSGGYYWGYDPFYTSWYSPVVININVGRWWPHTYYSYHARNRWYGSYRPVYNNYYNNNYYYYNTLGSQSGGSSTNIMRRDAPPATTTSAVNASRREGVSPQGGNQVSGNASNNNPGQGRRGTPATGSGNQTNRLHQDDQGNNNSLDPGNTNNVNRGVNSGNNPGRGNNNVNNNNNNNRHGSQGLGNTGRTVVTAPYERRQTGVSTPSTPSVNRSVSTGRPSSVSRSNTENTGRQPAVSTPRSVSSAPAVRSTTRSQSSNTSRPVKQEPTPKVSKSSEKSESSKSSSSPVSGSRRK